MRNTTIKIIVLSSILIILILNVNFYELLSRLSRLSEKLIFIIELIITIQVLMLGFRWCLVGKINNINISRMEYILCIFISQAFSQLAPASVGADIFRVWWLRQLNIEISVATQNVLLDRLAGFWALLLLNILCLPLLTFIINDRVFTNVIIIITVLLILSIIIFSSNAGRLIIDGTYSHIKKSLVPKYRLRKILKSTLCILMKFRRLTSDLVFTKAGIIILMWGILIHIVSVLVTVIIASSVGIALNLSSAFAVMPSVLLLTFLPISIGGWGIREAALSIGFNIVGISLSDSVFVGLCIGTLGTFPAFIGLFLWVLNKNKVIDLKEII